MRVTVSRSPSGSYWFKEKARLIWVSPLNLNKAIAAFLSSLNENSSVTIEVDRQTLLSEKSLADLQYIANLDQIPVPVTSSRRELIHAIIHRDYCAKPLRDPSTGQFKGCASGGGGGGGGGGDEKDTRELQRQLREELAIEGRRRGQGTGNTQENTRTQQRQLREELAIEERRRGRGTGRTEPKRKSTPIDPNAKPTEPEKKSKPIDPSAKPTEPKKKSKPIDPSAKPTEPKRKSKPIDPSAKPTEPVKKKRRKAPRVRPACSPDSLQISDGRVEIWKGTDTGRQDPSFKVRRDRNFEYKVKHDGQELSLNNHDKVLLFQGETIKGVPPLYPRLRTMSDQAVFDGLAKTMSHVESAKSVSPPVPDWKPTLHGGKIDKQYVRSTKGAGDYNGMQLHHKGQWARRNFDNIYQDVKNGQITMGEAKAEMRSLLVEDKTKPQGYSIKMQEQRDREFVVLAGGVHDTNSPLYYANHPMGIHPDTGNRIRLGIPQEGVGGRKWMETFRPAFWKEYYIMETRIAQGEINRRIKAGQITPDQAQKMWTEAHGKVKSTEEFMSQRRAEILAENARLKASSN